MNNETDMQNFMQDLVRNFERCLPASIQIHFNLDEITDRMFFEFITNNVKHIDNGDGIYEFMADDIKSVFVENEYYRNAINECHKYTYTELRNEPHSPMGAYILWSMVNAHPNLLTVYVSTYNIGTIKASLKDESALGQMQTRDVPTSIIDCVLRLRMFCTQEQTDNFNKILIANDGISNYYLARNFYVFMRYGDLINALKMAKCTELVNVFEQVGSSFKDENVSYLIVTDYDKY